MDYPFPQQAAYSHAGSYHSPSSQSQYLVVPPPRSASRHSHHRSRSHSHSGHHDHAAYAPNLAYTHSDSGHHHSSHHYPSHSSHHTPHHYPSHSTYHIPQYAHSTHSHHSRAHSRAPSHTPSHAYAYQHSRDRTPSIGDRVRQFFGMDPSDHYYPHQTYRDDHHHRRHNSFSGFRDDSRLHRSNSTRTGPWPFGAVHNQRYLDEHGREIDHRGRLIHRM